MNVRSRGAVTDGCQIVKRDYLAKRGNSKFRERDHFASTACDHSLAIDGLA